MKQFEILSGRCLVAELPENYTLPEIISNYWRDNRGCDRIRWSCPRPYGGWLKTMQRRLPPGNWRIIGMLSEVTEEQIILFVDWESNPEDIGDEWRYRDYQSQDDGDYRYSHYTALESLESAILAEGYHLDKNPLGSVPECGCTGPSDKGACDGCDEFIEMRERVLSRERCLLLGRED